MATAHLERRLLAILAADVVGYSRLMEKDEASTIARLKAIRAEIADPLVADHRGRLIKLMGDGTLVAFDSVVDAVACAIAIQRAVAERNATIAEAEPIVFRMGVNLGDVALVDGDVYGDGVNIATRLQQQGEPGGVMVSGTAYDHLQGRLDQPLDFVGEQHVKNITRPVRVYRVRLDGMPVPRRWPSHQMFLTAMAALVALVFAGGVWWLWPVEPAPLGRASIAVLPFDNLGGDAAAGRLADGITEDIITDLARFRDLDVIARNSTGVYKGEAVDVRRVGKELDVRYVLEGSLQRQGEKVRVTAQLVDASTGAHVWSERWDRPAADVFAVETEIAEQVASSLGGYGLIAEADRLAAKRKRPTDLSAYDSYLLGVEAKHRYTKESSEEAVHLLRAAVTQDPKVARAWVALAWAYLINWGFGGDLDETQGLMRTAAEQALALDLMDAEAHVVLAVALGYAGDFARAEAEFDRAMELNPNNAIVPLQYAGWASSFGKPDRGVEAAKRVQRLDPNYPVWASSMLMYAYFMGGRYADVLPIFDRLPRVNRMVDDWAAAAASYAALGRGSEARVAVADALVDYPELTVEGWTAGPEWSGPERKRLVETMRAAGFPLCAKEEDLKAIAEPVRLPECVDQQAKH